MTVCSQVNSFYGFKDARPKQNPQAKRSRLPCRSRPLLILNGQRAQEKSSGLRFCSYYSNSGIIKCLHLIYL